MGTENDKLERARMPGKLAKELHGSVYGGSTSFPRGHIARRKNLRKFRISRLHKGGRSPVRRLASRGESSGASPLVRIALTQKMMRARLTQKSNDCREAVLKREESLKHTRNAFFKPLHALKKKDLCRRGLLGRPV